MDYRDPENCGLRRGIPYGIGVRRRASVVRTDFCILSIWGRNCGAALCHTPELPYRHSISLKEASAIRRRILAIGRAKPRITTSKHMLTERATRADLAGKPKGFAAFAIFPTTLIRGRKIAGGGALLVLVIDGRNAR